jgi:hypothetical protein
VRRWNTTNSCTVSTAPQQSIMPETKCQGVQTVEISQFEREPQA